MDENRVLWSGTVRAWGLPSTPRIPSGWTSTVSTPSTDPASTVRVPGPCRVDVTPATGATCLPRVTGDGTSGLPVTVKERVGWGTSSPCPIVYPVSPVGSNLLSTRHVSREGGGPVGGVPVRRSPVVIPDVGDQVRGR